jgi:hypothetical protein
MHAHNRTLIAKLGFADPDRKEPLHDAACRYLGEGNRPHKLAAMCCPDALSRYIGLCGRDDDQRRWGAASAALEVPVSKGEDQYKQTIGFLDVVLSVRLESRAHLKMDKTELAKSANSLLAQLDALERDNAYELAVAASPDGTAPEWGPWIERSIPERIAIEVKIGPTSYSEVLRQINFYREHAFGGDPLRKTPWVLAAAYDMNEKYVAALANEKVHDVRLGQAFRDWAANENETAITAKLEEI